jgi:DNA modification methylase/ParB-like chromosome segregation protein Spo0J
MEVKLEEVKVGERFRDKFEDIELLAESISKYGLIEPIVVDEEMVLIAGERRYKAHQLLKKEMIEIRFMKDLSELEKKEVELEENIQRKQFTWQEEVNAKDQLHKLKRKVHGGATRGVAAKEGDWLMKDTARALGVSTANVSMDISLARGMKAFPELQKEKNKNMAMKKLKQKQEALLQSELAKRLKAKSTSISPDVVCGNCIEEMGKMKAESVDLILTDPPYGIDVDKAHTYGRMTVKDTRFEDGDFETFDLLDKAFAEMYRILKDNRHMYIFCGIDKVPTLIELLRKHKFTPHHLPLIWDKGSGSYPSQSTSFVHSYEAFIHIQKGRRKLNGTPRDIFSVKRVPSNRKIHPTEKPTELLRDLIGFSTLPGETVFDPFSGSGASIIAARETSRKGIGVELDRGYHAKIVERLSALNGEVSEVFEESDEV